MNITLDPTVLRKKTEDVRVDKKEQWTKAPKLAYQHMIDIISSDAFATKAKEAASQGNDQVDFYTWEFVKDKNDRRYTFGNIRILDIVKKTSLIYDLRMFINKDKDINNGFYVGYHITNKQYNRQRQLPNKYALFISWRPPRQKKEQSTSV